MSPEQAAGRLDLVGPPSNIYSLGRLLYCLLTGKPPFVDKSLAEPADEGPAGDFRRPPDARPESPAALEAVCLKAITREPEGRYARSGRRRQPRTLARGRARISFESHPSPGSAAGHSGIGRWSPARRRCSSRPGRPSSARRWSGASRPSRRSSGQRAEVNFARDRDAVEQMLVAVGDVELADVPQMGPVQKRLLKKALRSYLNFLTETPDFPAIGLELGGRAITGSGRSTTCWATRSPRRPPIAGRSRS